MVYGSRMVESESKTEGETMTEHSKKCKAAWAARAVREAWEAAREAREAAREASREAREASKTCPKCKELRG
jgi:hypothetical protein